MIEHKNIFYYVMHGDRDMNCIQQKTIQGHDNLQE